MNIESCTECGVVVDINVVKFIKEYNKNSTINEENIWEGDNYFRTWVCPACAFLVASDQVIH